MRLVSRSRILIAGESITMLFRVVMPHFRQKTRFFTNFKGIGAGPVLWCVYFAAEVFAK